MTIKSIQVPRPLLGELGELKEKIFLRILEKTLGSPVAGCKLSKEIGLKHLVPINWEGTK